MKYEEEFPIMEDRVDRGLYFLINDLEEVVYVGMSSGNILSRISAHRKDGYEMKQQKIKGYSINIELIENLNQNSDER